MRYAMAFFLTAAVLGAAACGQSEQDKAKSQVCDARSDLQQQVDQLRGLSLSTATVDGVKGHLNAIRSDLDKMRSAQDKLDQTRKSQVQQATQDFTSQVSSILSSLGSSTSLSAAATQLKTARAQLATSYQQSFAKISC